MVRFESGVLILTLKILLLAFTIAGVPDVPRLVWQVAQEDKLGVVTVPTSQLKIVRLDYHLQEKQIKNVFGVLIVKWICTENVSLHFTLKNNNSEVKKLNVKINTLKFIY